MDIKSFKYLRWTKYLTLLYFLFCMVSNALFMLHRHYYLETFSRTLFSVATLSMYLWIVNPMVLIVAAKGMDVYLEERKDADKKAAIGRRWTVFPICAAASIIAFTLSGMLFVGITGGV